MSIYVKFADLKLFFPSLKTGLHCKYLLVIKKKYFFYFMLNSWKLASIYNFQHPRNSSTEIKLVRALNFRCLHSIKMPTGLFCLFS